MIWVEKSALGKNRPAPDEIDVVSDSIPATPGGGIGPSLHSAHCGEGRFATSKLNASGIRLAAQELAYNLVALPHFASAVQARIQAPRRQEQLPVHLQPKP